MERYQDPQRIALSPLPPLSLPQPLPLPCPPAQTALLEPVVGGAAATTSLALLLTRPAAADPAADARRLLPPGLAPLEVEYLSRPVAVLDREGRLRAGEPETFAALYEPAAPPRPPPLQLPPFPRPVRFTDEAVVMPCMGQPLHLLANAEPIRDRDKDWRLDSQRDALIKRSVGPRKRVRLKPGQWPQGSIGKMVWSKAAGCMVRRQMLARHAVLISHTHCIVTAFGYGVTGQVYGQGLKVERHLVLEAYLCESCEKHTIRINMEDLEYLFAERPELLRAGFKPLTVTELCSLLFFEYRVHEEWKRGNKPPTHATTTYTHLQKWHVPMPGGAEDLDLESLLAADEATAAAAARRPARRPSDASAAATAAPPAAPPSLEPPAAPVDGDAATVGSRPTSPLAGAGAGDDATAATDGAESAGASRGGDIWADHTVRVEPVLRISPLKRPSAGALRRRAIKARKAHAAEDAERKRNAWLATPTRLRGLELGCAIKTHGHFLVALAYEFPERKGNVVITCYAPAAASTYTLALSLSMVGSELRVGPPPPGDGWTKPQRVAIYGKCASKIGLCDSENDKEGAAAADPAGAPKHAAVDSISFGTRQSPNGTRLRLNPVRAPPERRLERNRATQGMVWLHPLARRLADPLAAPLEPIWCPATSALGAASKRGRWRHLSHPPPKPCREIGRGRRLCSGGAKVHGVYVRYSVYRSEAADATEDGAAEDDVDYEVYVPSAFHSVTGGGAKCQGCALFGLRLTTEDTTRCLMAQEEELKPQQGSALAAAAADDDDGAARPSAAKATVQAAFAADAKPMAEMRGLLLEKDAHLAMAEDSAKASLEKRRGELAKLAEGDESATDPKLEMFIAEDEATLVRLGAARAELATAEERCVADAEAAWEAIALAVLAKCSWAPPEAPEEPDSDLCAVFSEDRNKAAEESSARLRLDCCVYRRVHKFRSMSAHRDEPFYVLVMHSQERRSLRCLCFEVGTCRRIPISGWDANEQAALVAEFRELGPVEMNIQIMVMMTEVVVRDGSPPGIHEPTQGPPSEWPAPPGVSEMQWGLMNEESRKIHDIQRRAPRHWECPEGMQEAEWAAMDDDDRVEYEREPPYVVEFSDDVDPSTISGFKMRDYEKEVDEKAAVAAAAAQKRQAAATKALDDGESESGSDSDSDSDSDSAAGESGDDLDELMGGGGGDGDDGGSDGDGDGDGSGDEGAAAAADEADGGGTVGDSTLSPDDATVASTLTQGTAGRPTGT